MAYMGLKRGVRWDEMAPLAHATGANHASFHLEPYEIVHFHEQTGWSVFLDLSPGGKINHSIVLKAIERDAETLKIKRIAFFDSDVVDPKTGLKGHVLYTDNPCDFWASLAKEDNAMLVRWEGPK